MHQFVFPGELSIIQSAQFAPDSGLNDAFVALRWTNLAFRCIITPCMIPM
jgi:hypothetical protein